MIDFFLPLIGKDDTKMPAVLLEVGYLTNPRNEAQMFTDDFQYRIAASIREGMKEYLKIS